MDDRPRVEDERAPLSSQELPFLWWLWPRDLPRSLELRDRLVRTFMVLFTVIMLVMILRQIL